MARVLGEAGGANRTRFDEELFCDKTGNAPAGGIMASCSGPPKRLLYVLGFMYISHKWEGRRPNRHTHARALFLFLSVSVDGQAVR